ncbi:flagellar basal body L-ring protein FlgH [Limnohabitans sp. DM1]|uniref:flagellar basal body L-ring protein FlgH n=1 Tax=Limnohabitans sp. DM1 TaxID=1597955 RepID=UPI000B7DE778
MLQRSTLIGVLLSMICVTGCETLRQSPKVALVDPSQYANATAKTLQVPAPSTPNGSLFLTSSYRPAFESYRARLVGDIMTIEIMENVNAKQSSSSSVNRSTALNASVTALPLLGTALNTQLSTGVKSGQNFAGKGGTVSENNFSGTITATVVDVLPNGHLVLYGEKQMGLNENVEVLKFSGTVDPRSIRTGNVISSAQVANARIASGSLGAQGDAQAMGWLSRIFMKYLPF